MTQQLQTVERETGSEPDWAIIWLHGLGADGHDFQPIADQLSLSPHQIRYVFPHAPVRPVTLNGGMPMRAWFDVGSLARGTDEDAAGIAQSAAAVEALIAREVARGIESRRIVLAGFSQGGAMALHVGTRQSLPLAAILALSTYLPLAGQLETQRNPASGGVPIFMAHGAQDPVVAPTWGEVSRDTLRATGYQVTWRSYRMPHTVCPEEIADLRQWLLGVFAGTEPA